jgi:hypothetical protein
MGYYRVLLHCELPNGFSIDGEPVGGFYTTRFVDASFDVAAGKLAVEELQHEAKFRDLRAQLSAAPVITAEEIQLADTPPAPDASLIGFAFYPVNRDSGDAA